MTTGGSDPVAVVKSDPYLEPFQSALRHRHAYFQQWLDKINKNEGSLDKFSRGYQHFGFTYSKDRSAIVYREWAPNAHEAYLIGDFSTRHTLFSSQINGTGPATA